MTRLAKAIYVFLLLPIIVPSAVLWTIWHAIMAGKSFATDIADWVSKQ